MNWETVKETVEDRVEQTAAVQGGGRGGQPLNIAERRLNCSE